jgi:hypothetical protein
MPSVNMLPFGDVSIEDTEDCSKLRGFEFGPAQDRIRLPDKRPKFLAASRLRRPIEFSQSPLATYRADSSSSTRFSTGIAPTFESYSWLIDLRLHNWERFGAPGGNGALNGPEAQ